MTGWPRKGMSEEYPEQEVEVPGLTIGISGPARKSLTHRLISLGLRLHGARTHYIRPGSRVAVALLDGLVLSGGTHVHPDMPWRAVHQRFPWWLPVPERHPVAREYPASPLTVAPANRAVGNTQQA